LIALAYVLAQQDSPDAAHCQHSCRFAETLDVSIAWCCLLWTHAAENRLQESFSAHRSTAFSICLPRC
jgi:hypothetical protein